MYINRFEESKKRVKNAIRKCVNIEFITLIESINLIILNLY